MSRVIVLRPEPSAAATIERALQQGLEPIAIPLFEIERVAWRAPDPSAFDGLLLTSANAVRQGGEELARLRGLPVYAVGSSTAEVARAAGFDIASTGEAGVDRLLGSIEPEVRLLHLCGENRRAPEC
jgi:uroporphyrinogen-III synthase